MTAIKETNKKRALIGVLFSLLFIINVNAAQDFIVENRTSPLFVVNGTTFQGVT